MTGQDTRKRRADGTVAKKDHGLGGVDLVKLKDWLGSSNGYSIMPSTFFTGMGFEVTFVDRYDREQAGGSGKFAVNDGEKILDSCIGVSEFQFLNGVAGLVGVPLSQSLGRGSGFRETRDRILKVLP